MKIFHILYFFFPLAGCWSNDDASKTNYNLKSKTDTVIAEIDFPLASPEDGFIKKEYFIVVGKDTSKYSLMLTKSYKGRLSISYNYTPYWKSDIANDSDTAAISDRDLPPIVEDKMTYEDQIREWEVIMKDISKKYDLSQLKSIRTALSTFKGLSDYIKPTYDAEYKKRLDAQYRGMVDRALLASMPKRDLDKILLKYGLIINDVSTDGVFYFEGNDGKPSLDGKIIFSVKKVSE